MTLTRDNLGTIERSVAVLAFDYYDTVRANLLPDLELFTRFLPEEQRLEHEGYPDRLPAEWLHVFPQWREWIGPRVTQTAGMKQMWLEKKDIELTFNVKTDSLSSPRIRDVLMEMSKGALAGYPRDLITFAGDLIASNPVVYDGQNLFDTDHEAPDGSTASNLLDVAAQRTPNLNQPTEATVRAELERAKETLIANSVFHQRYYKDGDFPNLVIFARQRFDALILDQINRKEYVGDSRTEPNPWRGRLTVIRRLQPSGPVLLSYDVTWPIEGGPRPVVMVEAKGPKPMRFDPNVALDDWNKTIDYGTEAKVYHGPGMWQSAVRIDYSAGGG